MSIYLILTSLSCDFTKLISLSIAVSTKFLGYGFCYDAIAQKNSADNSADLVPLDVYAIRELTVSTSYIMSFSGCILSANRRMILSVSSDISL
jgi:hypothetical protein